MVQEQVSADPFLPQARTKCHEADARPLKQPAQSIVSPSLERESSPLTVASDDHNMEWVGARDDGDGNGVPRASPDDEKMFDEEDESSDSKDSSEAQMGVDMGYTRGRGESGDKSEEQSRRSIQANDDNAPGGSAVCDKFDDFADAYSDEPPPNWQEDDHTKGTEDHSDNYSSDEDEDDDSDGNDDQSKNRKLDELINLFAPLSEKQPPKQKGHTGKKVLPSKMLTYTFPVSVPMSSNVLPPGPTHQVSNSGL
ncbi:hypothetical protein JVT61DRAFT_8655 [Boletus reticuloceps]|uniref:Uncharacterized protein n=1 Tax=Boletus reticuloceps TaxID=495285 RepID=A0A8I2YW15_9AGAM|nr:hypothetical protein JVT61DRAFT_8655 [Boletus reticuloceps]